MMRILYLIAIFFICNIKIVVSQISDLDTINNIINNYFNYPKFDNYPNNSIVFPETIHCDEKTYHISDINLSNNNRLKDNYLYKELPDSLFDVLFELDIINRWTSVPQNALQPYELNDTIASNRRLTVFIPPDSLPEVSDLMNDSSDSELFYKNREDYLKKMRTDSKMYSPGNVSINKNFVSKLVYVFLKDEIMSSQALYLVNIKDNQLRSITTISSDLCILNYCNSSSHLKTDFRLLDNQTFSLKETTVFENKEDENRYVKEIFYFPIFYYDNEGYLHIIPNTYDFPPSGTLCRVGS